MAQRSLKNKAMTKFMFRLFAMCKSKMKDWYLWVRCQNGPIKRSLRGWINLTPFNHVCTIGHLVVPRTFWCVPQQVPVKQILLCWLSCSAWTLEDGQITPLTQSRSKLFTSLQWKHLSLKSWEIFSADLNIMKFKSESLPVTLISQGSKSTTRKLSWQLQKSGILSQGSKVKELTLISWSCWLLMRYICFTTQEALFSKPSLPD